MAVTGVDNETVLACYAKAGLDGCTEQIEAARPAVQARDFAAVAAAYDKAAQWLTAAATEIRKRL